MDTDAILTLLKDVAEEVVTPRFRSLSDDQIHEKAPGDLVTDADREAEVLITRALNDAYPDAVVLGEETVAGDPSLLGRYAAASHAFTVDPIDGTRNFVHGSPDHAVMAAELRDGTVVRSWIWQPQHDLAYVAELGAGAFCNGVRLERTAPSSDPAAWRAVTSRRSWVGRSLPGMTPLELTWLCCGVDYPHLVDGGADDGADDGADAILYVHARPWDHAPGSLLLEEAGAHLGLADGGDYDPRHDYAGGLVAAADKATYDDVVARLRETGWR